MRNPEVFNLNDDELKTVALQEIAETLHTKTLKPDLIKVFRYHHAIPQYGRSSVEKLECIARLEKQYPGLILAGNIRDGIGMADRTKQGRTIADQLS
jgi:oxygen-dependent protoporphyrinogen oxidase